MSDEHSYQTVDSLKCRNLYPWLKVILPFLFVYPLTRSYIHRLCEEINDTLQEAEQVSIADLSKKFGLPIDFLVEVRAYIVAVNAMVALWTRAFLILRGLLTSVFQAWNEAPVLLTFGSCGIG